MKSFVLTIVILGILLPALTFAGPRCDQMYYAEFRIIDAANGNPIPGAKLWLTSGETKFTGRDGYTPTFSHLGKKPGCSTDPGGKRAVASADGYETISRDLRFGTDSNNPRIHTFELHRQ